MSRAHMHASTSGLHLGSVTIPVWALVALALVVVLLIVGVVVFRLVRRARRIAGATDGASQGTGDDFGGHSFGYFGAVTSAISITPDVKSKSRGGDGSKSQGEDGPKTED
ncbi:MAG: hypothetical protein L0G69_14955 [Brevibacterium sp.]|nr:hypothetical protein [Brevibacterium sp.]